jgi:hypothetical protein
MTAIFGGHFCVLGVMFLCGFNGPFLGDIGSVDMRGGCLSPSSCKLPEDRFERPRGPFNCSLSPVNLWLEVV